MNDYLIYTHGRMRRTLGVIVYFTQRLQLELSQIAQSRSFHRYHRIWSGCSCNMFILNLQPQLTKLGPDPIWMVLWYIHMHVRNWDRFYWHQQCHRRLRCIVPLSEFNDIGIGSNVNDLRFIRVHVYEDRSEWCVFVYKKCKRQWAKLFSFLSPQQHHRILACMLLKHIDTLPATWI